MRFTLLAEDVMKNIDYQSLVKFKEASRDICEFLDNGRVLWKQIILKNISGNNIFDIEITKGPC